MTIKGRGKLVGELQITPAGLRIRLDDDHNLEFWAELHFTPEELVRLSRAVGELLETEGVPNGTH